MALPSILNVVEGQIERVRGKLDSYFESSTNLFAKIGKGEVEQLSQKLYRIPIEIRDGGNYGKFSADGGSMGHGTAFKLSSLTAGYIYSRLAFRMTLEMMDTTANQTQATTQAFPRQLARGMKTAQVMADIELHGDGTGRLTNDSSAAATNTITFADATDTLKMNRLREGMGVNVWDTTGATKRVPTGVATDPLIIESLNFDTNVVTLDRAVTAIAATDILAIDNLDVYGPAALTTGSATWPAPATAGATGLGGDSWRHGVEYVNDSTDSTYYLGRLKSTIPQLLPSHVAAGSTALSFSHGLRVDDKIRQRRDEDVMAGSCWMFHQKQREQIVNIGMSIVNKDISPGNRFGKTADLIPEDVRYTGQFEYCNSPAFLSKRQRQDRIDKIALPKWGRAQARPMDFFQWPGGRRLFEGRDSGGAVQSYMEWWIIRGDDYVCFDPGAAGYVDGLTVPAA